jgi:uncharacterized protein (UPF0332 family)
MIPQQDNLLKKSHKSLAAAKLLQEGKHYEFAASRAYYVMFYAAKACLLSKNLVLTSHTAVVGAFGREFAKTGSIFHEMHRYLLSAMEARHLGDYDDSLSMAEEESAVQIKRAEQFLETIEL